MFQSSGGYLQKTARSPRQLKATCTCGEKQTCKSPRYTNQGYIWVVNEDMTLSYVYVPASTPDPKPSKTLNPKPPNPRPSTLDSAKP